MKNVMKTTLTTFVEINENESTISKCKKFNESSFKRFILSALKRSVFSASKIESKDLFIFRILFASQTISDNTVKSDDDLSAFSKKFSMTTSTVLMLNHARAYVKKDRDYLRAIYDTLKALKDEKNFNIVIQELRKMYIKDRNALKKRKKVKKKHDIVDVF